MFTSGRVLVAFLTVLVFMRSGDALETDQFTTPPHPLKDFGGALQAHVAERLTHVIEVANANRQILLRDAELAPPGPIRQMLRDRADEMLSADYIADRLSDDLSPGLPECVIEQWAVQNSAHQDYQFAVRPSESIYGNFFQRPITLQELSPTINMFGVYIGTDKIGHFFQQGHEYYRIYRDHEDQGVPHDQAVHAAVKLGISQEHGLYGEAFVGVYSNADLAANFAGLHFYLNLTRPLELRGKVRPPILVVNNGRWQFNPNADSQFLFQFFSDHMNESMNTCRYMWYMRNHVRSAVAERGARWADFYHTTAAREVRHATELLTWYGQDYGHSGTEAVFTAADVCFPPSRTQTPSPLASAH